MKQVSSTLAKKGQRCASRRGGRKRQEGRTAGRVRGTREGGRPPGKRARQRRPEGNLEQAREQRERQTKKGKRGDQEEKTWRPKKKRDGTITPRRGQGGRKVGAHRREEPRLSAAPGAPPT